MDQATQENAAAATEQGAAQPDASKAAPEQSAPTKPAAETKLEGQLAAAKTKGDGYKQERDGYKKERDTVTGERNALKQENELLKNEVAGLKKAAEPAETEEPSEEEYIKDLLRRNGLKVAYMLSSGPCFVEAYARQFAGEGFEALTTISVD